VYEGRQYRVLTGMEEGRAAGHTVLSRQTDRWMKADSKECRQVRRKEEDRAAGHTVIQGRHTFR
jgi:hypothetical protein